ncbi:MAG: acetylornithine transaminase [Mariprofundales bacterium]|nr:acetylornithine transaminase [Mariprofundales bacterium]
MDSPHIMTTYGRYPLTLVRGDGAKVYDDQGREYLDFVAGIAVNTLGHNHPDLIGAITEQAQTMLHCSNLYHIPQQQQLATRLCQLSGLDRAFFCNSGAEANEAAIKLTRKFFFDQPSTRHTIITANQSFHGRLLATIAATGQEKVKVGFSPLPTGFIHVPLNDLDALSAAIDPSTAAILLEPLQGEGGVNLAHPDYLRGVRRLCDQQGLLLILDEIQTGIGRTGSMFAFEQAGICPDMLTLAKGLGGGVPIGALLATERVAASFTPGSHGSTFGGNPLSCAAANCVLEVIERDDLLTNVQQRSTQLITALQQLAMRGKGMVVRGQGLLLGLDCGQSVAEIITTCRQRGLLLLPAGPNVLRLLPPLTITRQEIDQAVEILTAVLKEYHWI